MFKLFLGQQGGRDMFRFDPESDGSPQATGLGGDPD